MMKKVYEIEVAGVKRDLPLCKVTDDLYIAAFVIFGDIELTVACARELIKIAPEYDIIITAESKGIPLVHEIARQTQQNEYVVARKNPKLYMAEVVSTETKSITTEGVQKLHIGKKEADMMKGKKVLIVDDVISQGETVKSVEKLVDSVGGIIVGKMAILKEGDACTRSDIIALQELPIFNSDGSIKG